MTATHVLALCLPIFRLMICINNVMGNSDDSLWAYSKNVVPIRSVMMLHGVTKHTYVMCGCDWPDVSMLTLETSLCSHQPNHPCQQIIPYKFNIYYMTIVFNCSPSMPPSLKTLAI